MLPLRFGSSVVASSERGMPLKLIEPAIQKPHSLAEHNFFSSFLSAALPAVIFLETIALGFVDDGFIYAFNECISVIKQSVYVTHNLFTMGAYVMQCSSRFIHYAMHFFCRGKFIIS